MTLMTHKHPKSSCKEGAPGSRKVREPIIDLADCDPMSEEYLLFVVRMWILNTRSGADKRQYLCPNQQCVLTNQHHRGSVQAIGIIPK